jgi:DNA-binding NarL/FixJ family response regulator
VTIVTQSFATHRILIADGAPMVREALRWLLDDEPNVEIIGEAGNGPDVLTQAQALSPDIVILDARLPALDGFAVTRALKRGPHPPLVILLLVSGDPTARQRGLEAGSDGFIEKGADWPEQLAQVRELLAAQGPAAQGPASP